MDSAIGGALTTPGQSLAWAAVGALMVFGTRHPADDGVDVGALALDFVDVETPPCDAVVANTHDEDATLLKRRAVSRPRN
jgi:hypothetical protein